MDPFCRRRLHVSGFRFIAITAALLIAGIFLFTLAQPNLFILPGVPFAAYVAYVPVFLLARMLPWKMVWLYGLVYGVGCYCLFTYWLATFHPMGILVISFLYGLQLMLVFPLLKAASVLFKRSGWLVQWAVWCAYEFVKTLGFAGFHYGVTAYSHWNVALLRQCADIAGVWGLNALITFVPAWISGVIVSVSRSLSRGTSFLEALKRGILACRISGLMWVAVFISALIYGGLSQVDYSKDDTVQIALIQQNSDPWKGGVSAYERDLDTLMRLSDAALKAYPETQLVVWPETAFIPRIVWHYRFRNEREKYVLVDRLLKYLDNAPVPFVLGNDHAVQGYTRGGEYGAVDYNAVLYFTPGVNVIPPQPLLYSKMHLVPFTEYFPFEKQFPEIYRMLLNGDTHMWEPGSDAVVFGLGELSFGTPICFEDTFGYIARRFVNGGANAIINLSNDAWSKSLACQYQHLSMAVFRSVENRVPSVRATSSGQTCIIDPNGKVVSMAEPFEETYLAGSIPVRNMETKTLYTRFGDYAGIAFAALAVFFLAAGMIRFCIRKYREANRV